MQVTRSPRDVHDEYRGERSAYISENRRLKRLPLPVSFQVSSSGLGIPVAARERQVRVTSLIWFREQCLINGELPARKSVG